MNKLCYLAIIVTMLFPGLAGSAELPFYLGSHYVNMTAIQQDRTKSDYVSTSFVAGKYFYDYFALEARYGSAAHERGKHQVASHEETPETFLATFLRADWGFDKIIFLGLAGYNWQGVMTTNAGVRKRETKGDFAFGMGLEYRLTPHLALEAEYIQYLSRANVEFTGLNGGVLFRF
jgi:opacity protein-like surface antigen